MITKIKPNNNLNKQNLIMKLLYYSKIQLCELITQIDDPKVIRTAPKYV